MSDSSQNHVPLERARIAHLLGERAAAFGDIAIYSSVASTNDWALHSEQCPAVCLAEHQQRGRGRRGRSWVSPQAHNIYMSLAWSFRRRLGELGPLSLVAGIGVARTLRSRGVDAQLKWPNDVMVAGRKIAGILVEVRSGDRQQARVAVGIGLNFDMSGADTRGIAQPWTDFISECRNTPAMDRNPLVAELLGNLVTVFEQFDSEGFTAFQPEWRELDMCWQKEVTLAIDDEPVHGEARGVDDQGALRVLIKGEMHTFYSGDVSVRVGE